MTHICVGKLIIIGSDNGLSPDRRQAIIWTNAGILLIGPLETNQWNLDRNSYAFIQENAFEDAVWKMAAILPRPQCVNHIKLHNSIALISNYIYDFQWDVITHPCPNFNDCV